MGASLHVVFGAGQVGTFLARELAARGLAVRVARRGAGEVPPGAELVRGDAADAAFCAEAARGASAVYHCMNPPYSARIWAELVPRFAANLAQAAGRAGARLIVLDNLYALGPTGGRPMSEDTPFAPSSKKGEIRARAAALLAEAERRGDVRAVVGRASDFYGPGGEQTFFGPYFWPAALAGKPVTWVWNPDPPHTYHFIPDVARALAALGTAEGDVLGKTFMLPCAPAEPTRALVAHLSAALGNQSGSASRPGCSCGRSRSPSRSSASSTRCSTSGTSRSWWTTGASAAGSRSSRRRAPTRARGRRSRGRGPASRREGPRAADAALRSPCVNGRGALLAVVARSLLAAQHPQRALGERAQLVLARVDVDRRDEADPAAHRPRPRAAGAPSRR